MRRTSLLVTTLAAACSVYEPSLLTGRPGSAGVGGDGGATAGLGGAGASSGRGGSSAGGTAGSSVGGSGGGGTSSGTTGEGGMDAEGGDGGEAATSAGDAGAGGGGGAGSGGKSGSAGTGGSAGASAGSAGKGAAGSAGSSSGSAGSSSGASGTAGAAGSAGSGGAESCTGATGCARLSVPLAALNDRTLFSIGLGAVTDFSTAIVSFRVRRVSASGGRIWAYVQHGGTPDYNLIYGGARNFDQLGTDWTTVTWDVGATVPAFTFDKAVIARVGIEIIASGTGPWTSPTVVDLDSIQVTGPTVGPWPFDTAASVSSASSAPAGVFWMSTSAPAELVVGSTLGWLP